MKHENQPTNLKHIKIRLIEAYAYSRLMAHGYEVDAEFIGENEDVRWTNQKTGASFIMRTTERGIELMQESAHKHPNDQAFIEQLAAERIFTSERGWLVASNEQAFGDMLSTLLAYLSDEQLVVCLRSKPCEDTTWIERGYFCQTSA